MKEIRIHGRGGQGVVLASKIFVNAMIKEKKFAASFPFFGFERRGAPVVGFIRFDDKPIRQKDQVYYPDCVVVFDETLFKAVNIYQGVKENSTLVLNTRKSLTELTVPSMIRKFGLVDATSISLETINTFIPNTSMLGALSKSTGWVSIGSLIKSARELLDKKILKKNIEMMEKAYEETAVFYLGQDRAA